MFDQKEYLKAKINNRLKGHNKYANDISKLIDTFKNLDILTKFNGTFENSTIGWIDFCEIINDLIAANENLTELSFKEYFEWFMEQKNTVVKSNTIKNTNVVDSNLLNTEELYEERMQRLSSILVEDDMTNSFFDDELSEEGMRSRGLIDQNETSLDAEELNVNHSNASVVVLNSINDTIYSPYSGTDEIYQIDYDTWAELETDKEFKVRYKK